MFEKKDQQPQTLSGGEAQRISIIRAFATNPSIVFADEPTGNLDEERAESTLQLILSLCKNNNTTMLMVSHNEKFKQYFDLKFEIKNKNLLQI